jgi:prevent-host-death family protein
MKTVGVRTLKQNTAEVLAEVRAGESVVITDRGRPVAKLVPFEADMLGALVASGRARRAKRSPAALSAPPKRRAGEPSAAQVLAAMRSEERY